MDFASRSPMPFYHPQPFIVRAIPAVLLACSMLFFSGGIGAPNAGPTVFGGQRARVGPLFPPGQPRRPGAVWAGTATDAPRANGRQLRPLTVCTAGTRLLHGVVTWSPRAASSYVIGCTLEVASGATLTIDPETVVKLGLDGGGNVIYVAPGARLIADGCPQPPTHRGQKPHPVPCPPRPIVFTSASDNTVGGASAPRSDTPSTLAYSTAIDMDGGASVYVDDAAFRHGATAVSGADPLSSGCAHQGSGSLVVDGSTLNATVSVGHCASATRPSHYALDGDTFDLPSGATAVALTGGGADTFAARSDRFRFVGRVPTVAVSTNGLPVQGFPLAGPAGSRFSSGGRLAIDLENGAVAAGSSWGFSSPGGAVLTGQVTTYGSTTIGAGASLASGARLTVGLKGRLLVVGSAVRPVLFSQGSSLSLTGDGSLSVQHARFWGNGSAAVLEEGCTGQGDESVRLTDSRFEEPVELGACEVKGKDSFDIEHNDFAVPEGATALDVTVPGLNFTAPGEPGRVTVKANVFAPPPRHLTQAAQPEVLIYGWPVEGIDLSGPAANRFTGQGPGRVLDVNSTTLPFGATWQVSPTPGEVLEAQTDYVFGHPGIAVSGTLTLLPGTIVKVGVGAEQFGGVGVGYGFGLGTAGRLVVDGSARHRVIFTSMDDDTVGGRSYGTQTTPTQHDYKWAVSASEGSHVEVNYAVFRHGWYAFEDDCGAAPEPGGTFVLTNSEVQDQIALGNCNGSAVRYRPVLQRDTFPFQGAQSGNFAAGGGYDPAAYQPAVMLYNLDPTGVALSGSQSCVFNGKDAGRVIALAGTVVPTGEEWDASAQSKAVLAPWPDTNYLTSPGIKVEGTLVLGPATTVKSATSRIGVEVAEGGDLRVSGSSSNPATFTAISDDSVDGDSNGDGSSSKPADGAFGTAIQFDHLITDMPINHAVFTYASTALSYAYMQHAATVAHADFKDNTAAMQVEETSGPDYNGIGVAPCVPPWFVGVNAEDDWFSPHGWPAPNIDLASFVGAVLPGHIPYAGTAYNLSGVGNLINEESVNFGQDDTVPWAIYSCAKLPFPFPLTAVGLNGVPSGPHYPSVTNAASRPRAGVRRRP